MQGGEALAAEAKLRKEMDGGLYLVNVKQGLWDTLEKCGSLEDGVDRHVFQTKGVAIRGIYQKLDRSICEQCDRRIFQECQQQYGKTPQSMGFA
jgi:SulP family sulfate permease